MSPDHYIMPKESYPLYEETCKCFTQSMRWPTIARLGTRSSPRIPSTVTGGSSYGWIFGAGDARPERCKSMSPGWAYSIGLRRPWVVADTLSLALPMGGLSAVK